MSDRSTKVPATVPATVPAKIPVTIRGMEEADIPAARAIFQLAFGTYRKLPDPASWAEDRDLVGFRWRMNAPAAFVAELDGEIVGSNFAGRWGSVGFFGPLTVHPDHWGRGFAQALLPPVMAAFEAWGIAHAGLYTFADSALHLGLYGRHGFRARVNCDVLELEVREKPASSDGWAVMGEDRLETFLDAARDLTEAVYPGLDLSLEIRALEDQGLGETLFLGRRDGGLDGLAICHCGRGSEAGQRRLYVKFAAVRPGDEAGETFDLLLVACEALARRRGLTHIEAGVSLAREDAHRRMIRYGFQPMTMGVHMHRPDEAGYHHADRYAIDDWR